jgi:excisionase family DNA binding protein
MTEILYTIAEVAERLRLHRNTIYRLVINRQLSAMVFGTQYRISETQLQEYINKNTIQTNKNKE